MVGDEHFKTRKRLNKKRRPPHETVPTLYVASANAHKLEEIHTILGKEFSLVSM